MALQHAAAKVCCSAEHMRQSCRVCVSTDVVCTTISKCAHMNGVL
jgi:hypothetical protein